MSAEIPTNERPAADYLSRLVNVFSRRVSTGRSPRSARVACYGGFVFASLGPLRAPSPAKAA